MAKKSKRQSRKVSEIFVPGGGSRASDIDFNPDYSYVKKDLRRIALLAGSFFTILIVLSFFLA